MKHKNSSTVRKYTYQYILMPPAPASNKTIVSKSLVKPHCFYCLANYRIYRNTIHICIPNNYFTLPFRYLALAVLSITLVQGFKSPSNMNISKHLDFNGHIKAKLMSKSKNQSCMNYSALEPVLCEKWHNIKLSQSVLKSYHILPIWINKSCTSNFTPLCAWLWQKPENSIPTINH